MKFTDEVNKYISGIFFEQFKEKIYYYYSLFQNDYKKADYFTKNFYLYNFLIGKSFKIYKNSNINNINNILLNRNIRLEQNELENKFKILKNNNLFILSNDLVDDIYNYIKNKKIMNNKFDIFNKYFNIKNINKNYNDTTKINRYFDKKYIINNKKKYKLIY